MSNFVLTKQHLREVLIFCFNWKKSAAEAHRMLVKVSGDIASTDKSCREKFENKELETLLEEDQSQTQEELAESLEVTQQAVSARLRAMGIIQSKQQRKGFLHRIVTGDEKEKRPEYEQKHDKVIFLHDNARLHVAKVVKKYLETLKWDVLPHPPYSPDIAPSDYWLFRRMQHDLASHRFTSFAEIENWLQNWIASKDELFFRDGIRKLPERWEKVVSDGQYFN
ncbi:MOS1T transposase, partial [Pseudoatta argentina]